MQPSPFKVCPRCGVGNHPSAAACQQCGQAFAVTVARSNRNLVIVAAVLVTAGLAWFGHEKWDEYQARQAVEKMADDFRKDFADQKARVDEENATMHQNAREGRNPMWDGMPRREPPPELPSTPY